MISIFGYMVVLIIVKWNSFWDRPPPSIIKIMIDLVMKAGFIVIYNL